MARKSNVVAIPDPDDAVVDQAMAILDKRMRRGPVFTDPKTVGNYLKLQLQGHEREHFAAVFLNTKHHLLAYEVLFTGTLDGSEVHPREVVKQALRHNASAVVIAHNHPSGDPTPSTADRSMTTRLRDALRMVDVRLLDHFVIGQGEPFSMASKGWV